MGASVEPRFLASSSETEEALLQFVNESDSAVDVLWVDYAGGEVRYHQLAPGDAAPQSTYETHPWRLRTPAGTLLGDYCGPSARVVVRADGRVERAPLDAPAATSHPPEWGLYSERANALGIGIKAFDCVCPEAVDVACLLIGRMLADSPANVVQRLAAAGCKLAIIARCQVTTDIPEHAYLKLANGGRDLDTTTRGLGGSASLPVTSCGEENLTMVDDCHYSVENILIHELGHTVMNVGLLPHERGAILDAWAAAESAHMYTPGIYMISNADEYWAEGAQSWFDATVRTDVNDGHNTREKLRAHDPRLAQLLAQAFGDGAWRFPHDSPAPLGRKAPRAVGSSAAEANGGQRAHEDAGAQPSPSQTTTTAPEQPDMDRARLAAGGSDWPAGLGQQLAACMHLPPRHARMIDPCGPSLLSCVPWLGRLSVWQEVLPGKQL
ncbi:hypothetical protein FOA52_002458 [Chlamydomonas sp. UWO 241]|nr:hypothetical protein FOA52_002458 [Chlamydomonas sp. UWO 241]